MTVLVNDAGFAGPSATVASMTADNYLKTIAIDRHGVFFGIRGQGDPARWWRAGPPGPCVTQRYDGSRGTGRRRTRPPCPPASWPRPRRRRSDRASRWPRRRRSARSTGR
ncbi:hypothetical protein [Actinomadura sp. 21ATH]|uniref:hypothetical protein n=1 Tax=Actinomadura sp. 21ATH TaxID=1735444 RepID=UPI0035C03CA2